MNVELAVPGKWTVQETRLVEDAVRERVGSTIRGVRRVRVRYVAKSDEAPGFTDEFIGTDVSHRSRPEVDDHDHTNGHSHNHTNTHD